MARAQAEMLSNSYTDSMEGQFLFGSKGEILFSDDEDRGQETNSSGFKDHNE